MKPSCPVCKKASKKPDKTWKYGKFVVEAYTCEYCKTQFREYTKDGKHSFTLKRKEKEKGGFVKA
jgi:hypothetical protein